MAECLAETEFAPAERAPLDLVRQQGERIAALPLVPVLLNSMLNRMLVLNAQRQIVFVSENFRSLLGGRPLNETLGLRPGEALECIHCRKMPGGCGTSRFCRECGAVRAILSSLEGHQDVEEWRMSHTTPRGQSAMDLLVFGAPLDLSDGAFSLFSVLDISHEKRRRALERIFFHDLLDAVGGLEGMAGMIVEDSAGEVLEEAKILHRGLKDMLEDIQAQKDLAAAEVGTLAVHIMPIRSRELIEQTLRLFRHHPAASARHLVAAASLPDLEFVSDPVLLRRVLGNLIKNALEASQWGQTVTVGCADDGSRVRFHVHSAAGMPPEVQLQMFNRSFTTKGEGRGLGTYSVKLLTETYLHGQVGFTTTPEFGTEFYVSLPKSFPADGNSRTGSQP